MKYKEGDELYYVNPFIFIIERVKIEMSVREDGKLYYIDTVGAYLAENDLFTDLIEAKLSAHKRLDEFYASKDHEICKSNPKLEDRR